MYAQPSCTIVWTILFFQFGGWMTATIALWDVVASSVVGVSRLFIYLSDLWIVSLFVWYAFPNPKVVLSCLVEIILGITIFHQL